MAPRCFPQQVDKTSSLLSLIHLSPKPSLWNCNRDRRFKFPKFYFSSVKYTIFPSYNHWVGIEISRCIHKKTQRHRASVKRCPLFCFSFSCNEWGGKRRRPSYHEVQEKAACQQLNTSHTTNTFIVMRKVEFFWQQPLILKCLGARVCIETVNRLHSSNVFITRPPPPDFIFKFRQYSLLEAF